MDFAIQVALAATVVTAAITDLYNQRIPNWLTIPATVLAFCLQFAGGDWHHVLGGVLGSLAGFSLLIGFYAKGGMGAGDVKLMACIGAFVGAYRVFWIFVYTTLIGGVYALGIIVYSMGVRGWTQSARQVAGRGDVAAAVTG